MFVLDGKFEQFPKELRLLVDNDLGMKHFIAEELEMEKIHYGPQIGSHQGTPIYETIESNGYKYRYDRLAKCDCEGYLLDQPHENEVMLHPGLIYRQI